MKLRKQRNAIRPMFNISIVLPSKRFLSGVLTAHVYAVKSTTIRAKQQVKRDGYTRSVYRISELTGDHDVRGYLGARKREMKNRGV